MRLIDADVLKAGFEEDGHLTPYIEQYIDACPTIVTVFNSGCNWISTKDRLPENELLVIIMMHYGLFDIGYFSQGIWRSECLNVYDDGEITHWIPLPEPPKEG